MGSTSSDAALLGLLVDELVGIDEEGSEDELVRCDASGFSCRTVAG